jgi:hypothetical protein
MPGENENHRNISHHGIKQAEGFATRTMHDPNCVLGTDMPPGLTSMTPLNADPHRAGPQMNFQNTPSAARPMNDMGPGLLPANGAINPDPHPPTPAAQVQARNTYAAPTWERKLR